MGMDSTIAVPTLLRDVAQDVAALRDSDLILTGVVRRVRAALGCDLAYISLNDAPTHHTEIRFSDGIRTPEYAAIRMPIGTGVLGMAAAGITTESADYLRDVAKLHLETVDAAVRGEGVAAILSTPLRAGDEVVGALTVANRRPGPFDGAQRAVLEDAALIGSLAVEIYSLHRRLVEQDEASRAGSARLSLSDELTRALVVGGGTRELLEIIARAIGGHARLGDVSQDPEPLWTRVPLDPGGVVDLAGDDTDLIRVLSPTVSSFLSVSLMYETAIEDARHLRESDLAERLLEPRDGLTGRPPHVGLPGEGSVEVHVIDIDDPNVRRAAINGLRRGLGHSALVVDRAAHIVVLMRAGHADRVLALLSDQHFHAGRATAPDESAIPRAFEEASLIAGSMRSLHRDKQIAARDELGVVAFALEKTTESAYALVNAYLGPLLGRSPRDARMLTTALLYLDCQGSVADVAQHLSIHPNTVRQRLDRLDALLPGWRSGPRALDIHVALRTYALLPAGYREHRPAVATAAAR